MRCEVVLLGQQHRQASACGIARYAGAVDAPADDGKIVGRGWGGVHSGFAALVILAQRTAGTDCAKIVRP
jgi:hypothetical protein